MLADSNNLVASVKRSVVAQPRRDLPWPESGGIELAPIDREHGDADEVPALELGIGGDVDPVDRDAVDPPERVTHLLAQMTAGSLVERHAEHG